MKQLKTTRVKTSRGELETHLPIFEVNKTSYLLNRLVRYYTLNSKQIHHPNYLAGRNRAVKPSGTGKGKSRQPRAKVGGRLVVSNVPNAVGGPIAHKPSRFSKNIKLNKRELLVLKRNALSVILRRKSTTLKHFDQSLKISFKENYKDIITNKNSQKTILVTSNDTLYKSLRNSPKVEVVKGFLFNKILRGGLKNKTIVIDEEVLYSFLDLK